jgi:hypothetical protein
VQKGDDADVGIGLERVEELNAVVEAATDTPVGVRDDIAVVDVARSAELFRYLGETQILHPVHRVSTPLLHTK